MDSTAKILISTAIAVILPVLIHLGTGVIIQDTEAKYPQATPYCSARTYNYETNRYEYSSECEERQNQQQQELKNYQEIIDENNQKSAYRAIIFMLVSLMVLLGSLKIEIRELAGGLLVGSAAGIVVSTIMLASRLSYLDETWIAFWLMEVVFVALVITLRVAEKHIDFSHMISITGEKAEKLIADSKTIESSGPNEKASTEDSESSTSSKNEDSTE